MQSPTIPSGWSHRYPPSASYQRFLSDTADIPSDGDRRAIYDAIRQRINTAVIRNIEGIWVYDSSERLTECHYAAAFLDNLEYLEFDAPESKRIIPGKTTLVEVSSCSAGVAIASIGSRLHYATELAIPSLEPARFNAVAEIVSHVRNSSLLTRQPGDAVTDDYINDAIGRLRSRALSKEGRLMRKQQQMALPNHAEVPITPQSFRTVARDKFNKLEERGVIPDAVVMALGNGTTLHGEWLELLSDPKYQQVHLYGYEGAHNPGVYQTLNGPMSDHEKENRVTLFGADGTYNLSNYSKGFSSVNTLLEQSVLRTDNTTIIREETWEAVFERLNRGQTRRQTLGRTSCAAIEYAKQLREEHGYENVAVYGYDKADRYRDQLVTNDNAVYLRDGQWSPAGVQL